MVSWISAQPILANAFQRMTMFGPKPILLSYFLSYEFVPSFELVVT